MRPDNTIPAVRTRIYNNDQLIRHHDDLKRLLWSRFVNVDLEEHLHRLSRYRNWTPNSGTDRAKSESTLTFSLRGQRSEVRGHLQQDQASSRPALNLWHGHGLPLCLFKLSIKGFWLGTTLRFCRLSGRLTHKRLSERQKSPLCCTVSCYPAQFSGVLASSCGNQYILCGKNDSRWRSEPSGRPLLLLKGHTSKCSSTNLQINPRTTQPAGSHVTLLLQWRRDIRWDLSKGITLILQRKKR